MIRQYRLEHFNGMEILVCECFRKHTWSQAENDAFDAWLNDPAYTFRLDYPSPKDEFRRQLDDYLSSLKTGDDPKFYGLLYPITIFDGFPSVVLRGPVVNGNIASLQVDYVGSVMYPSVIDEIWKFYQFVESRHWRDSIAHQIEKYGSLFGSEDD